MQVKLVSSGYEWFVDSTGNKKTNFDLPIVAVCIEGFGRIIGRREARNWVRVTLDVQVEAPPDSDSWKHLILQPHCTYIVDSTMYKPRFLGWGLSDLIRDTFGVVDGLWMKVISHEN